MHVPTGGDDCKLKLWDLRTGTTFPSAVKKDFSAGVTTTQSHPLAENIFAVGRCVPGSAVLLP